MVIDDSRTRAPRVAYVLKRFPRFSETFILNELLELQHQGMDVEVYSLLKPPAETRHAALSDLTIPVTYLTGQGLHQRRIQQSFDLTSPDLRPVTLGNALDESGSGGDLCEGKDSATTIELYSQAASLALMANFRRVTHLHAHFASNATTVAALAAGMLGIPFSFTAHARDIYHTYIDQATDDAIRARKIRRSAFTVTVSDYNVCHLRKIAPDSAGKIRRLYNGVNLEKFRPGPVDPARPHIVSIGRLVEKKGFSDLVDACAVLSRLGVDFTCSIIGHGPLEEELRTRVVRLGLNDRVTFPGALCQEEIIEHLQHARVFALPCRVTDSGDRDGLPTVLLEAMACGVATVSTGIAGIPEIIDSGETGFLTQPGDPLALARALETLLTEPDEAQRMGRNARAKAESLFDLRANVATLRNWFETSRLADSEAARP